MYLIKTPNQITQNTTTSMSSKIIKGLVYLTLALLVLYFIPCPIPIYTTLQGTKQDKTTIYHPVTISIEGWQFNYLFRHDQISGTLTITALFK